MNDYNFNPFQQVLVRDYETSKWCVEIYSHYDNNEQKHRCIGGVRYDDCIPYEGNKHLLGTTDSPQPKRWRADASETYWCVDSDGACNEFYDMREECDDDYYEIGNYFRTKEEAEEMAVKFKQLLKGGNK